MERPYIIMHVSKYYTYVGTSQLTKLNTILSETDWPNRVLLWIEMTNGVI